MTPDSPPTREAVARVRAITERTLSPEEFRAALAVPLTDAELEETRSLIRWFRRRYIQWYGGTADWWLGRHDIQ